MTDRPREERDLDAVAAGGELPRPGSTASVVLTAAAGLAVGFAGTLVHRLEAGDLPIGILLAVLTVAVGSVLARALARGRGILAYLAASFLATQLMTFVRPGGDVLVAGQLIGYAWLVAQPVAALAALVTPRRWYRDDA